MSRKHFYPALEQLEHRIVNYRFLKQMKGSILRRREETKEPSLSELRDFLENIH